MHLLFSIMTTMHSTASPTGPAPWLHNELAANVGGQRDGRCAYQVPRQRGGQECRAPSPSAWQGSFVRNGHPRAWPHLQSAIPALHASHTCQRRCLGCLWSSSCITASGPAQYWCVLPLCMVVMPRSWALLVTPASKLWQSRADCRCRH